MNPEIRELYVWSVTSCPDENGDGWYWKATGPKGDGTEIFFANHDEAMDYATDSARKNAAARVMMALMIAAAQANPHGTM